MSIASDGMGANVVTRNRILVQNPEALYGFSA